MPVPTDPRTFLIVGVPGAGVADIAAWFNAQPDAFALVNPHRRPLAALACGCDKVRRYWDAMRCPDCPDAPPGIDDVLDVFPRFVLPLTEAHYRLGGYAEEWHGELLDYRLLVRNLPLADFWLCVTREPALCTRTGWPVGRIAECQAELTALARVAGGVVIDADECAEDDELALMLRGVT